MAGGFGNSGNSKKQFLFKGKLSSEVLQDSHEGSLSFKPNQSPKVSTLKGILGLGRPVEINKNLDQVNNWNKEVLYKVNHLEQEQKLLLDSKQKEIEKAVDQLRSEIAALIKVTGNLEKQVEKVALDPIIDASEYQLNWLGRVKNFIANFRKNISEASLWVESFNKKKKKKNLFWNNVKNKKGGGEQYLFSNEHSASRSGA